MKMDGKDGECMDIEEDGNDSPELENSTLFGQLLKKLDEELEPSHLKDVVYLIQDKVGTVVKSPVDIKDHETPSSILRRMTNAMTEQETLAVLKHALNVMNLHIEDGSKRCSDVAAEYEKQLAKLRTEHHVFRTGHFVGRQEQLVEAMHALAGTDCLGVWISGMGGMGKTTLASEVCYRLVTNNRMNICKIDMRNRSTLRSLVSGLLSAKGNKVREEMDLTEQATEWLGGISEDTIVFLDNLDDVHMSSNETFYQFLSDITHWLENNQTRCKIKLLMTAREDGHDGKCLDFRIKSIQLTRLNETDSRKLLKWLCRKQETVNTDACYNVLDACGGCPLAIHMVSNLLRQGENADDISISIWQSGVPGIDDVIRSSFQYLDETAQRSLPQLSVFKCASFSKAAAASVLFQGPVQNNLVLVSKVLLNLQLRTFLEEKDEYNNNKIKQNTRFALHPVVFRFLKEIRKQKYQTEYLSSQRRFVTHYLKEIDALGPNLEADYSHSYQRLDADKVHIETMFALVADVGEDDFKTEKLSRSLTAVSTILFSPDEKLNVFIKLSKLLKSGTNEHLYWAIQEADSYLGLHKDAITEEQLQTVQKEMASMTKVSNLVKGEFYLVKCRLHKTNRKLKEALASSKISLNAFSLCEPPSDYFGERARAANAVGTVYYIMREDPYGTWALNFPGVNFLDEAEHYHRLALQILRDNLDTDIYPDIPLYLVNIGTILHAKGKKRARPDSNLCLQEALKKYQEGIQLDREMHLDQQQTHAEKLELCSEVYTDLKQFEQALIYGQHCLNLKKRLLKTSNPGVALAYSMIGSTYFRWCKQLEKERNHTEANIKLKEAVKYFRDHVQPRIRDHIKNGDITTEHSIYKSIKEANTEVFQATKDKDRQSVKRFYLELEQDPDSPPTPNESSDDSSSSCTSYKDMEIPSDSQASVDEHEDTMLNYDIQKQSLFCLTNTDKPIMEPSICVDSKSNLVKCDQLEVVSPAKRVDSGYESIASSSRESSASFHTPQGSCGIMRFESTEDEVFTNHANTGLGLPPERAKPEGNQNSMRSLMRKRKISRDIHE